MRVVSSALPISTSTTISLHLLLQQSGQALQWAAQEGDGVTNPGGVQGAFRHCVEGHGLMRAIGDGWAG